MTASEIVQEDNRSDFYHLHRCTAALAMVASGRGDWTYTGQWSSGTCAFRDPSRTQAANVTFPDRRATIEIVDLTQF